jgi:hypothetical protein
MKIEIPIFEIFERSEDKKSEIDEDIKSCKSCVKIYLEIKNKNPFRVQYEILKLPYVIRCKFISSKGFVALESKHLREMKKIIENKKMKILDIEKF